MEMVAPVEPKPTDVFLMASIYSISSSPGWYRRTAMATPAEFPGQREIQTNGFGMTNMKVTIGFRGKTGHDPAMPACGEVAAHNLADPAAARSRSPRRGRAQSRG